ncbi:MAG TPA: helix-turn-helix transcriptional regulator [bacterium]|nr:helix-turn-helix transcriptional regulator [bacterium]
MLRVEHERKKRGWTKSEVSYRAKIALPNYSRLERKKREPFKPELERLSDVFGISAAELMMEMEEA